MLSEFPKKDEEHDEVEDIQLTVTKESRIQKIQSYNIKS